MPFSLWLRLRMGIENGVRNSADELSVCVLRGNRDEEGPMRRSAANYRLPCASRRGIR